jgi:signal transduction histidine kinase
MKQWIQHFRKQMWVRMTTAICSLILFFLACEAASYGLIYWIRLKSDFLPTAEWVQLLVTQLLTFAIMACVATPIAFVGKRRSGNVFGTLISTINSVSKGDFTVKIAYHKYFEDEQFLDLVESINHMTAQLNELETLRQEFISNVSHEIQSPLTSIRGFARALQDPDLPVDMRVHYLGIIETESVRLSKLSENLLKLTSLESKHHPFQPKPYRLDLQLKTTILACEPQWREKNIEVEAELTEHTVLADEEMMSQVWINLIHNSIKFTPQGGTIHVSLSYADKETVVRITDTGIGMDTEAQQHIFERFYKADKSRNRDMGGNGLGLSIVKRIIDLHDGSITVHSTLGVGTAFHITLPPKPNPRKDKEITVE